MPAPLIGAAAAAAARLAAKKLAQTAAKKTVAKTVAKKVVQPKSGNNSSIPLGSPESRARLAVSENKKALEAAARKAKNNSIKKEVVKKAALKKTTPKKKMTPEQGIAADLNAFLNFNKKR